MNSRPARRKITNAELAVVRAAVFDRPGATLQQLCDEFARRTGKRICKVTLRHALARAAVSRRQARTAALRSGAPTRAGSDPPAACLTDAEWSRVADLFETPEDSRGRPAKYDRRLMVDACCHVPRTGCAWSALPGCFPPWQAVYKSLSRRSAQGRFERMLQRLDEYWRLRLARHPVATDRTRPGRLPAGR